MVASWSCTHAMRYPKVVKHASQAKLEVERIVASSDNAAPSLSISSIVTSAGQFGLDGVRRQQRGGLQREGGGRCRNFVLLRGSESEVRRGCRCRTTIPSSSSSHINEGQRDLDLPRPPSSLSPPRGMRRDIRIARYLHQSFDFERYRMDGRSWRSGSVATRKIAASMETVPPACSVCRILAST